jgi:rare lipoprotein A
MDRRFVWLLTLALVAVACGKKQVRVQPPPQAARPVAPAPAGLTERGIASWYGKPYDGRPAADGEIYNMETMVAAHRTLPFQTRVQVRNLTNGKTVEVRIVDRGPFVGSRLIDLSHAAARAIDMIGSGTAPVELTVLGGPAPVGKAYFAVQVGAFREKSNAERLEHSLAAKYGAAKSVLRGGDPPLWHVLAGREPSVEAAENLAKRLREEQKVPSAFVVRLDP